MRASINSKVNFDRKKQGGFTLIEMTISMIVIALFVAGALPLYTIYVKERAAKITKDNESAIYYALLDYKSKWAKYPCPASLTIRKGEADYGEPAACPLVATAVGTCVDGICAEEGPVQITIAGMPPTVTTTRVLRGAVPFRELGLKEDQAYDGYGHRLFYVVTERLTDPDLYNENHGGIQLIDATNTLVTNPTPGMGGTHFVIVSGGEDGAGFYTHEGQMTATCNAGRLEGENCDSTAQAIYRVTTKNGMVDNNAFDDFVVYNALREPVLWNYVETTPDNVSDRANRNIGIGMTPAAGQKLAVNGNLQVRAPNDFRATRATEKYCELATGLTECFEPQLLGKDAGNGEACTGTQVMVGFDDGHIRCVSVGQEKCPAGQYIKGFDSAGIRICDTIVIPPKPCASQGVTICAMPKTLPATPHLGTAQVTHNSRKETYTCNDGTWTKTATSGSCTCTATTGTWKVSSKTCSSTACNMPGKIGTVFERTYTTCAPYSTGIAYDCSNCYTPTPCAADSRVVCAGYAAATTKPLPASGHGVTITLGPVGYNKRESYTCSNGTWNFSGQSGQCDAPVACITESKTICGTPKPLNAGGHGTVRTITGGYNRSEQWTCNSGTWNMTGSTGQCMAPANCDPTDVNLCATLVSLNAGVHGAYQAPPSGFGAVYNCNNGTWNKTTSETCPVVKVCEWGKTAPFGSTPGSPQSGRTKVGSSCPVAFEGQSSLAALGKDCWRAGPSTIVPGNACKCECEIQP